MQINKDNIKNILVVRNDRLGEFLLNIPALRALKETFRDAKLIVAVNPALRELADNVEYIDEVIVWEHGKHSLFEKIRLLKLLRAKNIDMAIMLNPLKDLNILTYLAGIPIRVGYDRKMGFLLTHKIEDKKYLGLKHEVEYNLELVSLTGAATQDQKLCLPIDEEEIASLLIRFNIGPADNIVALHPWTSDPVKQWPVNNFCGLATKLIEKLGVTVVIVGGQKESAESKDLFAGMGEKLIDLTGQTDLIQLAQVLKGSKLLISPDSGPVHLACAVGTKVLAIFGNDIPGKSPRRWGPWGEGNMVIQKADLLDITAEEVFEKAQEALGRK